MKLYTVGEKGKAICEDCGIVGTTFKYKDVPLSDGSATVQNILVGVCDHCGAAVAIPPQSTPAIKAVREKATKSIEASIPAIYLDALDLACYRIDPKSPPDFRKKLFVFYVYQYASDADLSVKLVDNFKRIPVEWKSKDQPNKRFSLKVTEQINENIGVLIDRTRLSKTDLIKNLVFQINRDIVNPEAPKHMKELRMLSAVAAG